MLSLGKGDVLLRKTQEVKRVISWESPQLYDNTGCLPFPFAT